MTGIYAIYNIYTKQIYVGSSIDIEYRKTEHFRKLKNGIHINKFLQEDFNKWEESAFRHQILEEVKEDELLEKESDWISKYDFLYNSTPTFKEMVFSENEIILFWSKVKIRKINECWNWVFKGDKDGYGRFHLRRNNKKLFFVASRVSYFITHPNDNINGLVCHSCDNPSCCNPKHLFIGSHSKNQKDRSNKGRGKCKLDFDIAENIRIFSKNRLKEEVYLYVKGLNIEVCNETINRVLRGASFSKTKRQHQKRGNITSKYMIENIKRYYLLGQNGNKIAKMFNLNAWTVRKIIRKEIKEKTCL